MSGYAGRDLLACYGDAVHFTKPIDSTAVFAALKQSTRRTRSS